MNLREQLEALGKEMLDEEQDLREFPEGLPAANMLSTWRGTVGAASAAIEARNAFWLHVRNALLGAIDAADEQVKQGAQAPHVLLDMRTAVDKVLPLKKK